MKSQDARKEFEGRRQQLAALEQEQEKLSGELQELKGEQAAAIRLLAREIEPSVQRRKFHDLGKQAALVEGRLKELADDITKTQAAVTEAEAALKAAEAEEYARALAAAQEKEAAECERIRAELPQRKRRLYEGYRDLCLAIGSYMIDVARITGTPPTADDALALRTSMQQMSAADGLGLLSVPGPLINLQNWGMVKVNGGPLQQGGYVDLQRYVGVVKSQAQVAYLKEHDHGTA